LADLYQWWSNDLVPAATGDILTTEGTIRGEQRILRRLLTNPDSYIWHPEYGAGLPAKVGKVSDVPTLTALIRSQMFLEASVLQNPAPAIAVQLLPDGAAFVQIVYTDADTGAQTSLSFDVNV
jgi:hypothetical protein